MPSAARKTTIPVTRMSLRSYPCDASISSGPCGGSWLSLDNGMFGLQNLRQVRIVGLNQCAGLQAVAEERSPEGDHGHGHGNVLENSPAEVQVARGILEVRLDQPEHVPAAR